MIINSDGVVTLSSLPPTPRQRRTIFAVIVFLFVGYCAIIPFLSVATPQPTGFIEIILTLIMASNFITAGLVLAQCMLTRSAGLLVLANGYLFSSLLMIPYLLSFPGIFTAKPVLGESIQTAPFIYICWHVGFLWAVCGFAVLKTVPLNSTRLIPNLSILFTVVFVCGLVWIVTHYNADLPLLLQDDLRLTALGRSLTGLALGFAILTLAMLWFRRRSLLGYWLMVVIFLITLELSLVTFFFVNRNTLGASLGRAYFAVAALVLLVVLLAESTRLYADVARANQLLQRERNSRLLNLQAMVASIAHEVRQPLGAIVTSGSAALRFLERTPPDLSEVRIALNRIVNDGHRTSEIFDGLRTLFGRVNQNRQALNIKDVVFAALENLGQELQTNGIAVFADMKDELPPIDGNRGQLQEAVLNLVSNAIEAMAGESSKDRTLRITTASSGGHAISLDVEDSGPGIDLETLQSAFEAFVTTKPQGSGLGLAICRMIVEDHGGKITAANGKYGAVFRLVLPAAETQEAATANGAAG